MNWVQTIPLAELGEGSRHVVEINDGELNVLLVNHKGKVYAVNAKCPHLGGPLPKGEITEDGAIVCPLHHSAFDLATGDVKDWSPWPPLVGRVLGSVRRERALQTYPVRVEGGMIEIGLSET